MPIDYASHSAHVDLVLSTCARAWPLAPQEGAIPFVSTVDGERFSGPPGRRLLVPETCGSRCA
ncbi:MAG: hypothetical protein R3B09_09500 [Nannocystaceae bacterium]